MSQHILITTVLLNSVLNSTLQRQHPANERGRIRTASVVFSPKRKPFSSSRSWAPRSMRVQCNRSEWIKRWALSSGLEKKNNDKQAEAWQCFGLQVVDLYNLYTPRDDMSYWSHIPKESQRDQIFPPPAKKEALRNRNKPNTSKFRDPSIINNHIHCHLKFDDYTSYLSSDFKLQLDNSYNYLTPYNTQKKLTWQWNIHHLRRCISYWTWGFSWIFMDFPLPC